MAWVSPWRHDRQAFDAGEGRYRFWRTCTKILAESPIRAPYVSESPFPRLNKLNWKDWLAPLGVVCR